MLRHIAYMSTMVSYAQFERFYSKMVLAFIFRLLIVPIQSKPRLFSSNQNEALTMKKAAHLSCFFKVDRMRRYLNSQVNELLILKAVGAVLVKT